MGRFGSWKKKRVYRPELLLQQLEERIVLDASVSPAPQDHTTDHPATTQDQVNTTDTATKTVATDAGAAGGAGGGAADQAAKVPDSYNHVFSGNLNVVLISNNLADVKTISDAVQKDATVITYDAQHDNLSTITAKLQDVVNSTGHKIDNLAIVGHGAPDLLSLGTDQIQLSTLGQYQGTFQMLSTSLSDHAQIQFYGCSLAGDASGQAMVNSIATFTAATVFASTDTTGGNAHDWTLEYSSNSSVAMHTVLNTDALASDITPLADPAIVKALATDGSSSPTGYVQMGGKVYFTADDSAHGREIWVYDPANGSTTMLADVNATDYSGMNVTSVSSNPSYLTVVGGNKLFFTATDNSISPVTGHGQELWVYDGTSTHLVKDIYSGTTSSSPSSLVDVGGTLYFTATDASGLALWKSIDGTDAGTTKVNNTISLTSPSNLTNVNGTLMFTGTTTANGTELFKVNNTTGSIELVKDFNGTSASSSPTSLTNVNGTLYLTDNDGGGLALWQSNGTTAGTTKITNSLTITAFANLTNVNGTLFFGGTTSASGQELYKVDGTGSEVLIKDINPGTASSGPASLTAVGSTLYFTANDGTGTALWQSDGTVGAATKVANTAGVTAFANLANINGQLFFAGTSAATGAELYKVDAVNGVTLVKDIYSGTTGSSPTALTDIGGGKLAFTATGWSGAFDSGVTGIEPWVSNGTAAGTGLIQDIMTSHGGLNSGNPGSMANVNGTLYWVQQVDQTHGSLLWKYDGTTVSAVPGVSASGNLTNVNGTLFFVGNDGVHGNELMKIDASGNAVLVKDFTVGSYGSSYTFWGVSDDLLFFTPSTGSQQLWQTNGTTAGTVQVTGPAGFSFGGMTPYMTNVNGTTYFNAYGGGTYGWELFKTNGNGTATMVADINPTLSAGSNILYMTNANGTLFFSASDGTHGQELWKFNPTTDPAPVMFDINTTAGASSSPSNFTNVNGTLFFTATGANGTELYETDGTTVTLIDINTGTASSSPGNLTNVIGSTGNGALYFTATDASGLGLFQTDGTNTSKVANSLGLTGFQYLTNAGGKLIFSGYNATVGYEPFTVDATGIALLKDINGGTGSSTNPTSFAYLDGITYFKATDTTNGTELWQTDGTPGGTVLVKDIYAGRYASSNPSNFMTVNNTLFFTAANTGGNSVYADQVWQVAGPGTNHVPTVAPLTMTQTVTSLEDPGAVHLGQAISVTDNDANDVITATLALDNLAAGVFSANNGATYHSNTGFWSVTGTVAQVNTALANVTFTPNLDWNGTVNITTHVQDAKMTGPANGQITLNVTAVNDAPITSNLNLTGAEDNTLVVSGWTFNDAKDQVAGGSTANNPVSVHLVDLPLNGTLSDNGVALIVGADVPWADVTGGKVTFQPDANWNGSTSFHFTVKDDGGTSVAGSVDTSLQATSNITVTPVNDAPVNNGLPAGVLTITQSNPLSPYQSNPITFSLGAGNAITVSDVDLLVGQSTTPTASYAVDLSTVSAGSATGTVHIVDPLIAGLNITGNDTSTVNITGALADINTALNGMQFIPYADSTVANHAYTGTSNAHLTIVTHDNENIGAGPDGGLSATNTIDFTVQPVAHTPVDTVNTINVPANASSTISLAGGLSVHDGDLGDTLFVDVKAGTGVTGLGYGSGTTFANEYVFMGTESYLNSFLSGLKAQVSPGFSGPASVLITTADLGGHSVTDTMAINFAGPTSAPPVITTNLVGFTGTEDQNPVSLGGHVLVNDVNGDPLTVDLAASAGWSGLNATQFGSASVTGAGTAGSPLHITGSMVDVQGTLANLQGILIHDFNGTATFGVTVSDGINPPVTAPVDMPVIAVNDAPVNTVPVSVTVDEDVLTPITGISISDVDAGASVVQVTLGVANGTLQVKDTVAGGLTAADITGNASGSVVLNGTLAAINATLFDATGLQYQSVLNYNGSDTLTVSTNDLGATGIPGPLTTTDPVAITVNAVNDAPVNTVPLSATAVTDLLTPITGISISDVDAGTSAVQVTLSVASGTLQVNDTVVGGLTAADLTGNASGSVVLHGTLAAINTTLANATGLQYLSGLNYTGPDTLTVLSNDLGATGAPGPLTATDPVAITVNAPAVNHAPTISLSSTAQQTDPSGVVIFDAAHNDLISISDVDAGSGQLKVTLTATHGTMTLNGVAGLTFDPGQGTGTGDATMTFAGTLANINTALNGMTFGHAAGYYGLADITVTANDQGNTGSGGPLSATSVAHISAEPYNVWFHGFGTEAGYDVYNGSGVSYYTHDYTIFWQQVTTTNTWTFYNGTAWVPTDALGDAPYDGSFGPYATWFHDTSGGTYNGYDVYIGQGVTYFSLDYTAAGATYWQVSSAGAWQYYDGSHWYTTAGFNMDPVNVWFHGFGTEAGYDVYNGSGVSYYTQTYTTFWEFADTSATWSYFNGTAWVPTTGLGVVV